MYKPETQHCSDNRHYSLHRHYWLFTPAPNNFKGTIAGNRHYTTGTVEKPLLLYYKKYWYIL